MKDESVLFPLLTGLFAVLIFEASNSTVWAQECPATTTWIGANGSWFTGTNWSDCVPSDTIQAYINNSGQASITTGEAEAESLTVGENQGNSGGVTVDNSATLNVHSPVGNCNANLYIGKSGSGSLTVLNGGTVKCRYGYVGALQNPTRPNSNGTVVVDAGATWYIFDTPPGSPPSAPTCTGAGLFIGCTASSQFGGTASVNVKGTIHVFDRSTSSGPPGVKVGTSGTLTGNGLLSLWQSDAATSRTVDVHGTLAPSNGAITIYGNLLLESSANTLLHVTPSAPNDKVYVSNVGGGTGTAILDGRLSVIMSGTFTAGTWFTLLSADNGRVNTFDNESIMTNDSGPYTPTIVYDASNVYLFLDPD